MSLSIWEILLRLTIAVVVGFIIGLERERHNRPAGIKTHITVCIGAAIISLIQIFMVNESAQMVAANPELANAIKIDMGRLGAQVISGIGFLGAGTILHLKGSIKGLTTAATIWLVGCMGLAIGMGYYWIVGIAIIIVMLVLIGLRFVQGIALKRDIVTLKIAFTDKKTSLDFLQGYFAQNYIAVKNIEYVDSEENAEETVWTYNYTIVMPRTMEIISIQQSLLGEENILKVNEALE